MTRFALVSLSLVAAAALAVTAAMAAAPKPDPVAAPSADAMAERWSDDGHPGIGRWQHHAGGRFGMAQRRLGIAAAKDPSLAVLQDVRALERMYRHSGRDQDVPGLYRDVLSRSSDPVVRHAAGRRLARLEWQAGDHKSALEQMQKNLDDDLKRVK